MSPTYARSRHHQPGRSTQLFFDIDGTLVDSVDLHASQMRRNRASGGWGALRKISRELSPEAGCIHILKDPEDITEALVKYGNCR
jgi:phosphoglycolate phosphatase-like HAD superfamily hydrolase